MTVQELCALSRRKMAPIIVFSIIGLLAGIGAGFVLLTGTYSSSTYIYVGLSQSIPVISGDGSVVENYKEYQSDLATNMVTDVATLANNKQVIVEAASSADIANPDDYSVAATVEKTSHIINLTITGPNEEVQKLANQLPVVLQQKASDVFLLDNIQQIDNASEPSLSSTTEKHIAYGLAGLIVGLFVALLIIVLQDNIKPRIKSPLEIESNFELPVLGGVSNVAAAGRLKTVMLERCKENVGTKVGIAAVSGQDATRVVSQLGVGKDESIIAFTELPALMDSADSISKAVETKNVALVVRPYATLQKDVVAAIDQLRLAGVTILGFIVVD